MDKHFFKSDFEKVPLKHSDSAEIRRIFSNFLQMQHLYRAGIQEIQTKLEILDGEFRMQFGHNPIHHIESRLKSPDSILEKLRRKGLDLSLENARTHLTDIAGIRVICNYIDDIYRIAELLTGQDDVTLVRTKDYIQSPKPNGYRSLHLVIEVPIFLSRGPEPVNVEIQIRTIAMDFWASLEHQLRYKGDTPVSDRLRQKLYECALESSALDVKMQEIYQELQGQSEENEHGTNLL